MYFYEDTHTYIVQNQQVPSVTDLISYIQGDKYKYVNHEKLQAASEYGSRVHEEIQKLIEKRQEGQDIKELLKNSAQETRNYFNLIERLYGVDPIFSEKVVVLYNDKKEPIAAGRFDLIAKYVNTNEYVLCDFKTTTALNIKSVSAQLNIYKKAAEQSGYFKPGEIKNLAAIHLSGEKASLKQIPIFEEIFFDKYIKTAEMLVDF